MRGFRAAQALWLAAMAGAAAIAPATASTYFPTKKTCPVGGEKFQVMALASISQWGAMPDGMPLGSGHFPIDPPQCPGNGLVMYRDFTPAEVKRLAAWVGGEEYKALRRAGETRYYLAYRTAQALGETGAAWLLLSATWEAKNQGADGERARRYNEEFVAAAATMPADATAFESIAIRSRAANALRELGRFDAAEAARAAVVIAPDAGGPEAEAAQNREGWSKFLGTLGTAIARRDPARAPIDMIGDREAVFRCMAKDDAVRFKQPEPPALTAFEAEYCQRPELAARIAERRKMLERL